MTRGIKTCKTCGEDLPIEDFHHHKASCKECRARVVRRRQEQVEFTKWVSLVGWPTINECIAGPPTGQYVVSQRKVS